MGRRKKVEIQVHLASLFKSLMEKIMKRMVKMSRGGIVIVLYYPCYSMTMSYLEQALFILHKSHTEFWKYLENQEAQ